MRIRRTKIDDRNYQIIEGGHKKNKELPRCPACGSYSVIRSSTLTGGSKVLCIACGKRMNPFKKMSHEE